MGLLQNGKWVGQWYDTASTGGRFVRKASQFRNWITQDGSAGPSGIGGFQAEKDRYHLYVSHACPWAHRTMIFRMLKGLEEMISYSVVHWLMLDEGWTFETGEGVIADPLQNATRLHQIYTTADPLYSGRVTVPVLWDKKQNTIVSNESAEIIRMFNSAFDGLGAKTGDYYPENRREEIDAINDRIYNTLNNGVYKAGFATTQSAYEEAVVPLFDTLDWLEQRLSSCLFLLGENITEADWRLFTTLIRFDPVYHLHFKCNHKRLIDFKHLWAYTRDLYQTGNVHKTVKLYHATRHYYYSHKTINPNQIIPMNPTIDFNEPHNRG